MCSNNVLASRDPLLYLCCLDEGEGGTPQLMVWITAEPSDRIPVELLNSVVSVSWHYMTRHFFDSGETKLTSAPLAILTDALNRGEEKINAFYKILFHSRVLGVFGQGSHDNSKIQFVINRIRYSVNYRVYHKLSAVHNLISRWTQIAI